MPIHLELSIAETSEFPLHLTSQRVHVTLSAMLVYHSSLADRGITEKMVICAIVGCSSTSKRVHGIRLPGIISHQGEKAKKKRKLAISHSPERPWTRKVFEHSRLQSTFCVRYMHARSYNV